MTVSALGVPDKPIDFSKLQQFPHLSAGAFQHPLDGQLSGYIQKVPLFPKLIKRFTNATVEKQVELMLIANAVRLGPTQGHSLYDKFVKAAAILDLPKLPEIFISSEPALNAFAYGVENYRLVLFAPLVDALTEEETLAVVGHELGHVKCHHQLNMTMVSTLRLFGDLIDDNIFGRMALKALDLAVLKWYRMAELSCDRAALLVVQEPEVVASMLSKLGGYSRKVLPEINLESILDQAADYEEFDDDWFEKMLKTMMTIGQTHPVPFVRVREIMEWGKSKQFQDIMQGNYEQESAPARTAEKQDNDMPCPSCGHLNMSTASFCVACGGRLNEDLRDPIGLACPQCREVAGSGSAFCLACGASLRGAHHVCVRCETQVESDWKICPKCGNQLAETA